MASALPAASADVRMITIVPLEPSRARDWTALFDACGSSCFCRYWHFTGDKNAWLARCAHDAATNRDEQLALVGAGEDAARGLLAFEDDVCVGWMKLTPRSVLTKLRRLPVYKSLDLGPDEGAWSIGCMLVRESHRRRGVAKALIGAAPEFVREWGGRSVEAYPRHADAPLHDEEAWMGPERAFVESGFEPVAGDEPYRVFRRLV
jgi:GNAT superfamily N-acetyltransferase